jgi:hypothetical protein
MWKIGRTGSERAVLADLLDRFVFWTTLRVALVDISFLCVVAALLVELGPWPRKASFDS